MDGKNKNIIPYNIKQSLVRIKNVVEILNVLTIMEIMIEE
jgi:hypothetical protein